MYKDINLVAHLGANLPRILEKYIEQATKIGNCHHFPSLKFNDEY